MSSLRQNFNRQWNNFARVTRQTTWGRQQTRWAKYRSRTRPPAWLEHRAQHSPPPKQAGWRTHSTSFSPWSLVQPLYWTALCPCNSPSRLSAIAADSTLQQDMQRYRATSKHETPTWLLNHVASSYNRRRWIRRQRDKHLVLTNTRASSFWATFFSMLPKGPVSILLKPASVECLAPLSEPSYAVKRL